MAFRSYSTSNFPLSQWRLNECSLFVVVHKTVVASKSAPPSPPDLPHTPSPDSTPVSQHDFTNSHFRLLHCLQTSWHFSPPSSLWNRDCFYPHLRCRNKPKCYVTSLRSYNWKCLSQDLQLPWVNSLLKILSAGCCFPFSPKLLVLQGTAWVFLLQQNLSSCRQQQPQNPIHCWLHPHHNSCGYHSFMLLPEATLWWLMDAENNTCPPGSLLSILVRPAVCC